MQRMGVWNDAWKRSRHVVRNEDEGECVGRAACPEAGDARSVSHTVDRAETIWDTAADCGRIHRSAVFGVLSSDDRGGAPGRFGGVF
ncbi:MAG: hypothetical protein D6725_12970 [Planctomycetota bacterium]|nr:MAG: hypothetical protein D6725_12970 [Planctomycetota bacterium]